MFAPTSPHTVRPELVEGLSFILSERREKKKQCFDRLGTNGKE